MIAVLALSLWSACAPRASAAVVGEAGVLPPVRSAPLVLPFFAAPQALCASLPAAPIALSAPALGAAPAPAAAASAPAAEFTVVERRGTNRFGREIVLLDALDARDPGAGTAAHVDFALGGGQASLDDPLDLSSTEKLPHPAGAPAGADLSHQTREHLWFGLAVKPEYQGRGLGSRLLDEAVARMRAVGARALFIRATESSRDFYLRRFGASVKSVDAEDAGEGETLYRIEVDLSPR